MIQAVCRTPLAPLADGLGGHAVALGEDAGALLGAGDLRPRDGRGGGRRMDLQHRSDLPLSGLDQTFKQVAIRGNSMPHRVPTMFRNLIGRQVETHRPRLLPVMARLVRIRANIAGWRHGLATVSWPASCRPSTTLPRSAPPIV